MGREWQNGWVEREDGLVFGEGEEGGSGERTNVGCDACKNDLAFTRGLNGISELGIVPGVDFAVAFDVGGIGVELDNFLGEGAVGTSFGTGGEDNWEVEELGNGSVRDDVVSKFRGGVVTDLNDLVNWEMGVWGGCLRSGTDQLGGLLQRQPVLLVRG